MTTRTFPLTRRLELNSFNLLSAIGSGAFASVLLAREKGSGRLVCFKRVSKAKAIQAKHVDHLLNEIWTLSLTDHPFVVKLEGLAQDERYLFIGLEYVPGGELHSLLRSKRRLSSPTAAFYAGGVLLAIAHLHSKQIIFRDLKPENVVLDRRGYPKLVDFGLAKVAQHTYTLCGTPEYTAPEVILQKGHGRSVDWWAFGIFLYELLVGHDPFGDPDPLEVYQNILEARIRFPKSMESEARSLIKKLLERDLSKRFGNLRRAEKDIMDHRFFSGLSWPALSEQTLQAPFISKLTSSSDTGNFVAKKEDKETQPQSVDQKSDPFFQW